VIQRVSEARVLVGDAVVGEIGHGLVLLIGVERGDGESDVATLVRKVAEMRLFPDDAGKMNRSISDSGGSVLVVSQFTLLADVRKGRRPSFTDAADPDDAQPHIAAICAGLKQRGISVAAGMFGAHMQVELVNDGPVTIVLDVADGQVRS
jgi:D-tyrosyl-tRNA(Tyr) deacylase